MPEKLIKQLYGLELHYYNTGNICSAKVYDQKISNSKGRALNNKFNVAKVYYDILKNKWCFSVISAEEFADIKANLIIELDKITE